MTVAKPDKAEPAVAPAAAQEAVDCPHSGIGRAGEPFRDRGPCKYYQLELRSLVPSRARLASMRRRPSTT
jgi:hypothetical protein